MAPQTHAQPEPGRGTQFTLRRTGRGIGQWLGLVLAIGCASVSLPSYAASDSQPVDWSLSITPQTVAPVLSGPKARVAVVAATDDAATGRAGLILQAALQASGKPEVVIDGEVLGSVDGLDDQRILLRASQLGADTVAIIRVLDSEAQPVALVSAYKLDGTTIGHFRAQRSEPLIPLRPDGALRDPVKEDRPNARRLAQQEFDAKQVGFVGLGTASSLVTQTALRSLDAYQGKEQWSLTPVAFYRLVGTPQLADTYSVRTAYARRLLIGSGVAFGLSALTIGITAGIFSRSATQDPTKENFGQATNILTAGLVIGSAGIITSIALLGAGVVKYLDRHPVPPSEALRLATQHNTTLRRQLGLLTTGEDGWR